MNNERKSLLLALLAVLFWSTIGSAFKLSLNYLSYSQILMYASLVATLFLGILLASKGRLKSVFKAPASAWAMSAVMGLLNPFAYYLILLYAYNLLLAQEAVALNYTWPMVLVVFSAIFLKQKICWLSAVGLLVSFAGTFIIATAGSLASFHFNNPFGVGLALLSAFFWAGYWMLNMKDHRRTDEKLFMNFGFGFVYTLIYCVVKGEIIWPGTYGLAGSIYIGLFEMGITFVVWLEALRSTSYTARISNLVYLSPFLSLLLVSWLVGEKIMMYTLTGLAFIIGGILIQQLAGRKPAEH